MYVAIKPVITVESNIQLAQELKTQIKNMRANPKATIGHSFDLVRFRFYRNSPGTLACGVPCAAIPSLNKKSKKKVRTAS